MIYDHKKNIQTYAGLDARVFRGLELMTELDWETVELGRYEVDGDNLFYMVQEYDTHPFEGTGEAHRNYVDIQYLVSGQEKIGVDQLEADSVLVEGRPENDIYFYQMGRDVVTLQPGHFAVLWPQDIHAPALAVEGAQHCRKVVIKVKIVNESA